MSRATGGARPWNESAGRVGQRHLPRPPTSALIDAPRQSNFRLRASFFVAIITTATTPDSHPDCRALLIQIVALQVSAPFLAVVLRPKRIAKEVEAFLPSILQRGLRLVEHKP